MQQQLTEILFYLRGTLRYKWVAIVLAWVICLTGWMVVIVMPKQYTSEAKVHVETSTMLRPLMRGMTVESDVRALLRVMQQLMFTKNNVEQIIHLSDLEKRIKNPRDQEQIADELKKNIKITSLGDDIFTIKYQSDSPDLAKNVVQAVLTVFSEQTQLSTMVGADTAHHFIDRQIQEYEVRLRNAEKARENFMRINLGMLPGQGSNQVEQMQSMTVALQDGKLLLDEAISRKQALKEQLDEALVSGDEEWGELAGHQGTVEDEKIADLKLRRDDLLIKYTVNHPEIAHLNKTIKELEKVSAQKRAKQIDAGGLDSSVITNPYTQSIKIALNEADATVASIQSRVNILEKRLELARSEWNTRLSVETEMQNLNRDYAAIKKNYDQLLASREQANLSKKVDDQAESLKFKIADAPDKPLTPSSMPKPIMDSIILVAGICVGFGAAFLIYLIRPTVMTTAQLRQLTGLPVLGSVSMKTNDLEAKKHKKELFRYSFSTFGLIVIYISFMMIDILHIDVSSFVRLLQRIN
ncbi:XrtA system polysaccharide chain length determinant [Methylovulum miyakonense]|uniref:XrtA system polysaccharide chain length determinant n=1 Tax=Methylovulum miyakonense TaxID=645578 RepID=UPI00035F4C0B|nr:XrtA system polysaccharide chain length determinant [Methylovulum miyakonense]